MKRYKIYKCVLGEFLSKPNYLVYQQSLSSRNLGTWIGYCQGDKIHESHLIVFKYGSKPTVLEKRRDPFRNATNKSLGKRIFPRMPKLRCPIGKVYMNLQKRLSNLQPFPHVDIYKCQGNLKGKGHRPHLVKIAHGLLETKEKIRVLIVIFEDIN
jgi:hypothetical protein